MPGSLVTGAVATTAARVLATRTVRRMVMGRLATDRDKDVGKAVKERGEDKLRRGVATRVKLKGGVCRGRKKRRWMLLLTLLMGQ